MYITFRPILSLVLIVLTVIAVSLFSADRSSAQGGPCVVEAVKDAPGGEGLEFVFDGIDNSGPFTFSIIAGGEPASGSVDFGETTTITEEPGQNGYRFAGVICVGSPDIFITQIENGFTITCDSEEPVTKLCTIFNQPIASAIPTLSEWGMIAAAGGLMLVGVWFAVRRRRMQDA
jgi:hypothetical protein